MRMKLVLKRDHWDKNLTSHSAWFRRLNSFFRKTSYLSWQTDPLSTPPSWSLIKKKWIHESWVFFGDAWRWHLLCGGFLQALHTLDGVAILKAEAFCSHPPVWSGLHYRIMHRLFFWDGWKGSISVDVYSGYSHVSVVWGVVSEQL